MNAELVSDIGAETTLTRRNCAGLEIDHCYGVSPVQIHDFTNLDRPPARPESLIH